MINLKDLINRVYSSKECVSFDMFMEDDSKSKNDSSRFMFEANYRRNPNNPLEWTMRVVLPRTRDNDHQIYEFDYVLPKSGLALTLIAAMGLKFFQLRLQEEIQMKSDWNFTIGDIIKDI